MEKNNGQVNKSIDIVVWNEKSSRESKSDKGNKNVTTVVREGLWVVVRTF